MVKDLKNILKISKEENLKHHYLRKKAQIRNFLFTYFFYSKKKSNDINYHLETQL